MNLMFTNAQVYNETGSAIYEMAERMRRMVQFELSLLPESQRANEVLEPPLKRQKTQ